ncbi:MAG: hypothetical protein ABEJ87_02500 [Candidatus Nanohalobium sp.]
MDERFHGTSYDEMQEIARTGTIEASEFSDEEMFQDLGVQQNVYGTDEGVWVTDSEDCAQTYAWGGGYLVIDTSELKVVDDRNSCYSFVPGDVQLGNVEKIYLEENTQGARDYLLELAEELEQNGHGDIELQEYQGQKFEVDR